MIAISITAKIEQITYQIPVGFLILILSTNSIAVISIISGYAFKNTLGCIKIFKLYVNGKIIAILVTGSP